MNGVFLFSAYFYLVHFSENAEERGWGIGLLATQAVIAGISLFLSSWLC